MGLLLYTLARDRKGMATLLSIPAIALLGEASYGLYVLHMPLWALLNTAHTTLPPQGDLRSQVFTVFYCVGAILASVICFRVIEQPARRAIRHAFA